MNKFRPFYQKKFSQRQKVFAKKYFLPILAFVYRKNLTKLASIFVTDKFGEHWYTQHYQRHFAEMRKKKINLLEIGVGGYSDEKSGGRSLYMWKAFFFKANIFSIDIFNKKALEKKRIKIFQGSQDDSEFLKKVVSIAAGFDIIVDDGSHLNCHVIGSFEILFPLLNNGGWYVVEDLQTAYWPKYGGNSLNIHDKSTSINYFLNLVNGLNYQEFINPGYVPSYYDKNITEIHFYHNMVFIKKGFNEEGSNLIVNNIAFE